MPCKLLASVVLLAILLIIPTFVDAYSGEIDPKNYISLPVYLNSKDGIINSTIYISSSAGNSYNLYYKVMELKESEFNEINMKKMNMKKQLQVLKMKLTKLQLKKN